MDHPKTLIEFMELYPTEEDCRQALVEHRWPHGFSCSRCGHERAWYLQGRGLFECASCRPTAGRVTPPSGAPATAITPAGCPAAPTSIGGCPGRTSCSPTSSAGHWTSSTVSAPRTCRHTWTSTATGSTAAASARTSSDASSTAVCATPDPRRIPCSQPPELRGCHVLPLCHS